MATDHKAARALGAALMALFAIASRAVPATPSSGALAATVPAYVAKAVADPGRPQEQVARDADRKPAELLTFAGVKPGDRVADFISGGGYYTRLLSGVVGVTGRVYAFLPEEELKYCAPEETAGTRAIGTDRHYANVSVLRAPAARFRAPQALDVVWTSLNFHDLYDSFMGPANVPEVSRAMFAALKPGGVLLVVDHVAQAGSQARDAETLHRIDPQVIIRTLEAVGFTLEAHSDLLRNPADDHRRRVFDPAIRGHTDQVILKFRKPA